MTGPPTGRSGTGPSDRLGEALGAVLPDAVEESSFDPSLRPQGLPSRWWGRPMGEMRWQAELARLLVDPVWYGVGVPRGDGGPVLLVPGFLAGDNSLWVLHGWLRRMGHRPYAARILANVDCSDRAVDRLEERLEQVVGRAGRKAALVGHSRGGHFAKALAARRPDLVDRVVSLGAGLDEPFEISLPTKAAIAAVRQVLVATSRKAAASGCLTTSCRCPFVRDYSASWNPDVALTSVYSRGDGVVWWEACIVPYARNVEVTGSHVGLACNRKAYRAVAEALAP